eukprot:2886314-Alexandrium_andersonii.AAC.1
MLTSWRRRWSTSCSGPHPRVPSQAEAPTATAVARASRGAPRTPCANPKAESTMGGARPPAPKAKAIPRLRVT